MAKARAALTLTDLRASKTPPAPTPRPTVSRDGERVRRGQTLRLEPEAWHQLKVLAADQAKTSHDLLIEAVNLLFDKYNRPTIAG